MPSPFVAQLLYLTSSKNDHRFSENAFDWCVPILRRARMQQAESGDAEENKIEKSKGVGAQGTGSPLTLLKYNTTDVTFRHPSYE